MLASRPGAVGPTGTPRGQLRPSQRRSAFLAKLTGEEHKTTPEEIQQDLDNVLAERTNQIKEEQRKVSVRSEVAQDEVDWRATCSSKCEDDAGYSASELESFHAMKSRMQNNGGWYDHFRRSTMEMMSFDDVKAGRQHFVDHKLFVILITGAIILDAIMTGIDIEIATQEEEADVQGNLIAIKTIVQYVLAAIWTLEAAAKLWAYRLAYFLQKQHLLEFILCLFTLADIIVSVVIGQEWEYIRSLPITQAFRVVRVLRVLRLVSVFKELRLMLFGLLAAFRALCWTIFLMVLVIYIFAIVLTYWVGTECDVKDGSFAEWKECRDHFGKLSRSVYTLFELMFLELESARPLVMASPWTAALIVLFIMLTTFGLMNIIMGVIVEQILKAAHENEELLTREKEERQELELQMLHGLFRKADSNRDELLQIDEFVSVCERPDVQALFAEFGIPVSRARLAKRLFQVLDGDTMGSLDHDTFLARMVQLKQEGKSLTGDMTMLLMDVRHLCRRTERIEQVLMHGGGKVRDTSSNQEDLRQRMERLETLMLEVSDNVASLRRDIRGPCANDASHGAHAACDGADSVNVSATCGAGRAEFCGPEEEDQIVPRILNKASL